MTDDTRYNAILRELRELSRQLDSIKDRIDGLEERTKDEQAKRAKAKERAAAERAKAAGTGTGDDKPEGEAEWVD